MLRKIKLNHRLLTRWGLIILVLAIFSIWMDKFLDKDTCLDVGVCHEGLDINTEEGYWIINKENCLKNHYEWNDKNKNCKLHHTS